MKPESITILQPLPKPDAKTISLRVFMTAPGFCGEFVLPESCFNELTSFLTQRACARKPPQRSGSDTWRIKPETKMNHQSIRQPITVAEANSQAGLSASGCSAVRVGCAAIVRHAGGILLGKRDKDPMRGMWVLPGGGVKFGETFETTIKRELREEAGIEVTVNGVWRTYELINPPSEHRIIIYVEASHLFGCVKPSSDLSDARFWRRDELEKLRNQISPFVLRVLEDAGELERQQNAPDEPPARKP